MSNLRRMPFRVLTSAGEWRLKVRPRAQCVVVIAARWRSTVRGPEEVREMRQVEHDLLWISRKRNEVLRLAKRDGPLMNPFFVVLPQIRPSFNMLTRVSKAE